MTLPREEQACRPSTVRGVSLCRQEVAPDVEVKSAKMPAGWG
jgi:hypothetical protein